MFDISIRTKSTTFENGLELLETKIDKTIKILDKEFKFENIKKYFDSNDDIFKITFGDSYVSGGNGGIYKKFGIDSSKHSRMGKILDVNKDDSSTLTLDCSTEYRSNIINIYLSKIIDIELIKPKEE